SGKVKPISESSRIIERSYRKESSMRNIYKALTIVIGLAVVLMLAQVLVGQAPAQAGAAPGQGTPGGGGRGGPGGGAGGGRGGGAPGAPAGPGVRTADGKPDFTGYWMAATKTNINSGQPNMGIINPETGQPGAKIPYNPEWEAKAIEENKSHMFNEPYTHCLPAGVPTNFGI